MIYTGSLMLQIQDQKVQELPGDVLPPSWCYAVQFNWKHQRFAIKQPTVKPINNFPTPMEWGNLISVMLNSKDQDHNLSE